MTLLSIAASVAITLVIYYFATGSLGAGLGLLIAVIAPALIAPLGSYQYISLNHRLTEANEQAQSALGAGLAHAYLNRRPFLELATNT